tara:strand:+ start:265 stop:597 length:333 start_codon:yes stop_codon:yes gene_type:complete
MALSRKHYNIIADILQDEVHKAETEPPPQQPDWPGGIKRHPFLQLSEHRLFTSEQAMYMEDAYNKGYRKSSVESICSVAEELARYFQKDNPRFKAVTFLAVSGCGGHRSY